MSNHSATSRAILFFILVALLVLATFALSWSRTGDVGSAVSSPFSGIAEAIAENDPDIWASFAALLACEILGIIASLYLVNKAFKADVRTILTAIVIALLNFGTLYSQYAGVTALAPLDFLAFFKDGFFWFAALPLLAEILGVRIGSGKQ